MSTLLLQDALEFEIENAKAMESLNIQNVKLEQTDSTLVQTLQFEDLPDEIILKVLSNLTKTRDLIRCGHISKRIRRIFHDETIWKTFIFVYKTLPTDFLNLIVNNGCKNLRLHCVKIAGDSLNLINPSRLRCLDLTHCQAKVGVLTEILDSRNFKFMPKCRKTIFVICRAIR